MKPTKNHIFCIDCLRTKMLFRSKKEALRCIEFNGDEMQERTGKRPIRAYYCIACGGWHITSKEYVPGQMSRIERYFHQLDQVHIIQAKREELLNRIYGQMNRSKPLPKALKSIIHEFRLSVQKKHINPYSCEEIYGRIQSIFKELISFKMMTPKIDECFYQFCELTKIYHSKVDKMKIYAHNIAS